MLSTLRNIVEEIGHIPVLEDALQRVSSMLKEAMQVDCCAVYLADTEAQCFVLVATDGLAESAIGETRIAFAEGIIGWIGQREEPINIADAQAHPRFKHYPEVKEESYHAFLGTHIIHQRKVLGVLSIQQKSRRRFGEEEEALLITLAAQMALEVANAEVRGLLKHQHAETKRLPLWKKSLFGRPGSPGLALGLGYHPQKKRRLAQHFTEHCVSPKKEIARFRSAVQKTKSDIKRLTQQVAQKVPEDVASIFQTYDFLLDAASLGKDVEQRVQQGLTAASALKQVVDGYARQFSKMQDSYMQERVVDIVDLGDRVFAWLMDEATGPETITDDIVLVADEVTATMLAELPTERLKGMITMQGSQNSHAAILARAMGIPAVMGVTELQAAELANKTLLVDGYSGEITVSPDQQKQQAFSLLANEELELNKLIQQEQHLAAETRDAQEVELYLNVGLSQELDHYSGDSARGVGLYRTEMPFMAQNRFPTEQEQLHLYKPLLSRYKGSPVTMRTLDVGGDKPLSYFPYQEENPFLGWRGIRLTLDHPEIFLVQVRAMMRASYGLDNLQIMLPMISSVDEVKEARRLIRQAYYEVREESNREKQVFHKPKIGVMLEVPAVVWLLPELAELVDFFSVGSNDLTQYLLAVDRNNARVSALYQSYHPAVLKVLQHIATQSQALGVPVTVCGEIAAEPAGIMLLLAMGFKKLSINGYSMARVKWVIRRQQKTHLEQVLKQVMAMSEYSDIKDFMDMELEKLGLGGLLRAGR